MELESQPLLDEHDHHNKSTSTCDGDCFSDFLLQLETYDAPPEYSIAASEPARPAKGSLQDIYDLHEPLLPTQTRLLRLPPRDLGSAQSEMQLVIANFTANGFDVVGADRDIEYTAISYCWETADLTDHRINCNGLDILLPEQLIVAIEYHRRVDSETYLWIDNICINQHDMHEKADQVGIILDIYHHAKQVTAWLGPADHLSTLGMRCLSMHKELKYLLDKVENSAHTENCLQNVQRLYAILLALYDRPLLSRTWVRQESYAARDIVIVCGETRLQWYDYLAKWRMATRMYRMLNDIPSDDQQQTYLKTNVLIEEATKNCWNQTETGTNPRKLTDVLMQSYNYGATIEHDVIYAILRMCGISLATRHPLWSYKEQSFLIDYEQSSDRVYHDLSLWLLHNKDFLIPHWWNSYIGSGGDNLPTWVMHWRESRCNDIDLQCMRRCLYEEQNYDANEQWTIGAQWCPLQGEQDSKCVQISAEDDRMLLLKGRALNYVAYVSDYSCSMENFVEITKDPVSYPLLGAAAETIHHNKQPGRLQGLFSFDPKTKLEWFDSEKHDRRVAILGCGLDWQFALVPSATKKGDLVVALSPGLLPMILSPKQDNSYGNQFYTKYDQYEDCLFAPQERRGVSWTSKHAADGEMSGGAVALFVLFFICSFFGSGALIARATMQHSRHTNVPLLILAIISLLASFTSLFWIPLLVSKKSYINGVESQLRIRRTNFEFLDHITRAFNPHYQFIGPVMVRQGGPYVRNEKAWWLEQPSDRPVDRPIQTFYVH